MTINGWFQIAVFLALILAVTKPLGIFMARVFNREKTFLDPVLRPIERLLYRLTGVDENHEMRWTEYAFAMLLFSVVSMLLLYLIQRVQASCRSIRRSWQRSRPTLGVEHGGFVHHEYQLAGLFGRDHDELPHPDGRAGVSQLCFGGDRHRAGHRVYSRHRAREMKTIGNFWVDMVRGSLWVLLPFCIVGALVLVSQGVVQNLKPYDTVKCGAAAGAASGSRRQTGG